MRTIRRITPRLPLILMILGLTACASRSLRSDLDRVHEGMDKARVLEAAGNPKRTFHTRGLDHWVYVFFENERELARQIDFRDGIVTKVFPVTSKAGFANQLESADSMEEYEKAVKAHGAKDTGFRDVPDDGKP